ncbi:MAG: hypothetical protein JOZ10_14035 [Acidobacteria bacterium]|nr:hypothetical protein [Acidobacteriota bacterium]MBV9146922.1 hypothetical protein [Acidobacteriota bacterium]MBV9437167.1 hypothetical protein [Acidobacteriota bacterium]
MRLTRNQVRWSVALVALAASCIPTLGQTALPDINAGFQQMYNLDFAGAHNTFQHWEQSHPDDPMGPVSDAAAYLFSEFNRLRILEFDLFTEDEKFEKRPKLAPDPAVRTLFETELSRGDQLANRQVSASPNNEEALLALVFANGLRSDYAAMIEKKNLAALNYSKASRQVAEKLLSQSPSCYDAYLAVGIENYLLSLHAAPIRWLLRMGGAQTDKDEGIAKLKLTATKGHYLAPFARLLLAVAALRDKDQHTARDLLAGLSQEFPRNDLYRKELARIQSPPQAGSSASAR